MTRVRVLGLLLVAAVLGALLAAVGLSLPAGVGPLVVLVVPAAGVAAVLGLGDGRWAVAALAVALPAGLVPLPGGIQLVQLAAAGVVGLVVVGRALAGRAPLLLPAPVVALLVVLLLTVLSVPGAPDTVRAVRWTISVGTAVPAVAAVATVVVASTEALRTCAGLLLAGGAATCAVALPSGAAVTAFGGGEIEERAVGVFAQPNELGLFAGTTTVLALALLLGARTVRGRVLAAAAGLVALGALGLSLSRGAWIGTLLALLVLTLVLRAARRLMGGAVLATLVLLGLLQGVAATPPELQVVGARASVLTNLDANPYDERPAIWAEAVRQIRSAPWLGVGSGNYPVVAVRATAETATVRPDHAHDLWLTLAAESGVPAALALAVAVGLTGVRVLRRSAVAPGRTGPVPRDRALLLGVGCAPLVALGQGVVDFPLRNPTTLVFAAAVLGLAVAAGQSTVAERTRRLGSSGAPRAPSTPPLSNPPSAASAGFGVRSWRSSP